MKTERTARESRQLSGEVWNEVQLKGRYNWLELQAFSVQETLLPVLEGWGLGDFHL